MFRPATTEDAEVLFEWANDPVTRAMSRDTQPIPWDKHVGWFRSLLCDPSRVLWIWQERGREPEGSIRFTATDDGRAWVAYQVAPHARGKGLGQRILGEGTALYATATGRVVDGFVKTENVASQRQTRAAGFDVIGDREDGMTYFEFVPQNRSTQA